jgi:hypothetical protein
LTLNPIIVCNQTLFLIFGVLTLAIYIKGGIKMVKYKKYHPEDPCVITRYTGIRTFMKLPYVKGDLSGVDFAIIGIACDGGTTFRSGAAFGPSAIREMSIMLRNYNINLDIDIFEYLSGIMVMPIQTLVPWKQVLTLQSKFMTR